MSSSAEAKIMQTQFSSLCDEKGLDQVVTAPKPTAAGYNSWVWFYRGRQNGFECALSTSCPHWNSVAYMGLNQVGTISTSFACSVLGLAE